MGAPAILDAAAESVLARLNDVVDWCQTHVNGGLVADGGTTQGSGAGTALNFDVDTTAIDGVVKNFPIALAAGTDVDATAGISFGATSGKSVVYALVISTAADGASAGVFDAIPGAVANTGSAVPPTAAEIAAVLTHSNFVLVADVTVNRTADTTVTLAIDYRRRFGLNAASGRKSSLYAAPLSETEAQFRDR